MAKFVSKENLAYYHSKIKTPLNFAQEEYNKSLNEFNANLLSGVSGIVVSDNGKTITMPIMTGETNGAITTPIKLKEICPNMKVGKTYVWDFKLNYTGPNEIFFITNASDPYWWRLQPRTITQQDLDSTFYMYGNKANEGVSQQVIITDFMINEGTQALPYQPYNSNKHITNQQADFLKSEYDKSKNLFNGNLQVGAWIFADGSYTWTNEYRCSTNYIDVVPGSTITLSVKGNYTVGGSGFVFYNNGSYVGYADHTFTAIVPANANQVLFNIFIGSNTFNLTDIQLEYGSTATDYQPHNGEIVRKTTLFEGSLNTIGATFSADFTPYEKLLIHGSFYNETTIFELDLTRKSYAGGYTSSHSSITKNVDAYDSLIVNVNDNKNTFTLVNGGYHTLTKTSFTQHVGYDIFIYKVEGVKSV